MKFLISTVALVAFSLVPMASAQTLPIREVKAVAQHAAVASHESIAQQAALKKSSHLIGRLRQQTWSCQASIDIPRAKASQSVWALGPSLVYRGWVAGQWRTKAANCTKEVDRRTIPFTNDWVTAVNIAQRYFPGTKDRILFLSGREGGNGVWKWYSGSCGSPPCLWRGYHVGGDNVSGADTVGGWVQFRWSTFEPHWRTTKAYLEGRGYIIPELPMPPAGGPEKYAPWLNPLGQALTVAYMHWSGSAGCHWCP